MKVSKEDYLKMHGIQMREATPAEKSRAINRDIRYILTMPNGAKYYLHTGTLFEIISTVRYEIMR